jgi:hypothetical protein
VLSRQVPPTSSARSSTTKSSIPSRISRIAMQRPEKPAPTTATLTCEGSCSDIAGIVTGGS